MEVKVNDCTIQKATCRIAGAVSTPTAALAALQKYRRSLAQLTALSQENPGNGPEKGRIPMRIGEFWKTKNPLIPMRALWLAKAATFLPLSLRQY